METTDRLYLKVKIKSLEAEAKIIRAMEHKHPEFAHITGGLYPHRKDVVGVEQRHTLIAYGFIRGKKYAEIEPRCAAGRRPVDWTRVKKMVEVYGVHWDRKDEHYNSYYLRVKQLMFEFDKWLIEAQEHRKLRLSESAERRLHRKRNKLAR